MLHEQIVVLPVAADVAAPIARIYNHYVTESIVTFEEEPVAAAEMRSRIEAILGASLPWFVAVDAP